MKNVKLLCILASDTGLKHVQMEYPDLEVSLECTGSILFTNDIMQIWVAGVDKELTSDGIITPGLGDSASALLQPSQGRMTILAHRETEFLTPFDESYEDEY